MDDVISRAAALALAKDICVPTKDGTVYRHRCIDPQQIMDLPSAQSKTCEYWDGESNFCALHRPSAQPETAKRIVGKSRDGMTLWYQCDMCNEPVDAQDDFCRGCGRRLTDG